MQTLQYFDFTAAANGAAFQLGAPGRLIYYYRGSAGGADATIRVKAGNGGSSFLLKPGESYQIPPEEPAVDTWYIHNYAGTAPILGLLQIGDGKFTSNTTTGNVEVVDGGKSRTLSGSSFMVNVSQGAAAGLYSHAQLWNPAASGKNIVVEAVTVGSPTAGNPSLYLRASSVALTNLFMAGVSKKIGAPAASAECRRQTNAAVLGTGDLFAVNVLPNSPFVYACKEPIVIPPGFGLLAVNYVVNTQIDANFEWYEENV